MVVVGHQFETHLGVGLCARQLPVDLGLDPVADGEAVGGITSQGSGMLNESKYMQKPSDLISLLFLYKYGLAISLLVGYHL